MFRAKKKIQQATATEKTRRAVMVTEIKGDLKQLADAIRVAANWLPKPVPDYANPQAEEGRAEYSSQSYRTPVFINKAQADQLGDQTDDERAKAQKGAMIDKIAELIQSPYTDPDLKARLRSVLTTLQSAKSAAEINAVMVNVLSAVSEAESVVEMGAAANAHEVEKLWNQFDTREKEIQDGFEQFYKDGKISYEQMLYLRNERKRLDALPKDSDERLTDETKFAAYQKELGVQVRDEAHNRGDSETEKSAGKLVSNTEEQTKALEEIHQRNQGGKKEIKEKTATFTSLDDDAIAPPSISKEKQGMKVLHNVTLDDLQSPPGGKDRSSGRTIVKS